LRSPIDVVLEIELRDESDEGGDGDGGGAASATFALKNALRIPFDLSGSGFLGDSEGSRSTSMAASCRRQVDARRAQPDLAEHDQAGSALGARADRNISKTCHRESRPTDSTGWHVDADLLREQQPVEEVDSASKRPIRPSSSSLKLANAPQTSANSARFSTRFRPRADGAAETSRYETGQFLATIGFGLGSSLRHTEIPAVTYSPLEGKEFSQTLLSPISLEYLVLLFHSGWSIERIFRAFVRRLGSHSNAIGAGGPTPDHVPEFESFREVFRLLRELQIAGGIDLTSVGEKDGRRIVLRFEATDRDAVKSKQAELRKALGLEGDARDYRLVLEDVPDGSGYLRIQMRSFLSGLFFLSQAVEVPEEDEEAGLVTITKDMDDKVFDWAELLGDLIRVQSGAKPKSAAVAVRYRSTWFWIDDADLNSKSTFALLDQLFALQAAPVEGAKPVLRLPLSR